MIYRLIYRTHEIGMSASQPVRKTRRARLLENRTVRAPFLLWEGSVIPLDTTGLVVSPKRVIRHLLGTHHDGAQFVYDLELLSTHPGALEEVERRTRAIIEGREPRAEWLRDLCVYENYHEALLDAVVRARQGALETQKDPDISFFAWLRWASAQPASPGELARGWVRGTFRPAAAFAKGEA